MVQPTLLLSNFLYFRLAVKFEEEAYTATTLKHSPTSSLGRDPTKICRQPSGQRWISPS